MERNEHSSPLLNLSRGLIQEIANATGISDIATIPNANGSMTGITEAGTNAQKTETTEIRLDDGDQSHFRCLCTDSTCNYDESLPSKRFRTPFIEALNVWLQVPEKELKVIKKVVEMLHNAHLFWTISKTTPLYAGEKPQHI